MCEPTYCTSWAVDLLTTWSVHRGSDSQLHKRPFVGCLWWFYFAADGERTVQHRVCLPHAESGHILEWSCQGARGCKFHSIAGVFTQNERHLLQSQKTIVYQNQTSFRWPASQQSLHLFEELSQFNTQLGAFFLALSKCHHQGKWCLGASDNIGRCDAVDRNSSIVAHLFLRDVIASAVAALHLTSGNVPK